MPVATLYVNAFTENRLDWTRNSNPPYLNNNTVNWIMTDIDQQTEGDFGFANLPANAVSINSVNFWIEIYGDDLGEDDYAEVYIDPGTGFVYAVDSKPITNGWVWYDEGDISGILDTVAKVNAAQMYLKYIAVGGADNVNARRCRLEVDYDASGSEDLPATFEVGQGSENLLGKFIIPLWKDGWKYRKKHTITGTVEGAQTNYQIGIKVYYGAGVDGTEAVGGVTAGKVYCNSKCRTDFGDIRFTEADGQTEIDYWVEEVSTGSYAIFWVEVPNIPANPATVDIFVYYGHATASTTSNLADTFVFTEDWEACNLDAWSGSKTDKSCSSLEPKRGTYALRVYSTSDVYQFDVMYRDIASGMASAKLEFDVYWIDLFGDSGFFFREKDTSDNQIILMGAKASTEEYGYYDGAVATYSGAIVEGQYEKVTFLINDDDTWDFIIDGAVIAAGLDWNNAGAANLQRIAFGHQRGTVRSRYYVDDIRVSKWVDPEPVHAAWGPEQGPVYQDLYASFEAQVSLNLYAHAEIRQPASADLYASFEAQVSLNLYAHAIIRNIGSVEAYGHAEIRHPDSAEVYAHAEIRHPDSAELYAHALIKNIGSAELFGKFFVVNWLMAAGDVPWLKRIKLTIDKGDVSAALSDFPVLAYLSSSSGITSADVSSVFDEVGANSKRIAVTTADGVTECYVEIEKWDNGAETAWLWVKAPSVSPDDDTVLYLYYDISKANNTTYVGDTNSAAAEAVWDDDFVAVYHLRDLPDSSSIRDSTSYDRDGTKGAAGEPTEDTGIVGSPAQDFDGGDWINIGNHAGPYTNMTLESVFRSDTGLAEHTIVCLTEDDDQVDRVSHLIDDYWLYNYWRTDGVTVNPKVGFPDSPDFFYFATTRNGTAVKGYLDGAYNAGWDGVVGSGTIQDLVSNDIGATSNIHGWLLDGNVDEVRISKKDRGADWIGSTWESVRDHLITFGDEEVYGEDSQDLYAHVEIQDTAELYSHAIIRHPASAELYGVAEIQQSASTDLYASFEAQVSLNLYAHAIIRNLGSASLPASFEVGQDSADLYVTIDIQNRTSTDLTGKFVVRHPSSLDLPASFEVGQGSADLYVTFRLNQEQLYASFFAAHSRGQIDEIDVSTWGSTIVASPGFKDTAIERIRRSQGAEPKWILFQTSEGEVKVHDLHGTAFPQHDLDLAYDPDEIYINNLDPPHIAVKNGTTLRVYRNGSELFNTGAITNLRYHNISNGYLHTTVSGGVGAEWRSLVDGSVITTVAIAMKDANIWIIQTSEDGEDAYTGYRDTSGSGYGWLTKLNRLLGVGWRYRYLTGGTVSQIRCSGDGSLIVARLHGGGWSIANVYNNLGTLLNSWVPNASISLSVGASPTASHAAWARIGTTTARIVDRFGNATNIVLPAASGSTDSVDCLPGGYTAFACTDGNIYIYDLTGVLQDTIPCDTATKLAWAFEGAFLSFEDLLARFEVGQGSVDLYASFEAQVSLNLYAHAVIRNISSQELYAKFLVQYPFDELYGHAEIRNIGSAELYGTAEIRQPAFAELDGKAEIRNIGFAELDGHAEIQHPASADLYASFEAQVSLNLFAKTIIRNIGSASLPASFEVGQDSADLLSKFTVRQTGTEDLFAKFAVIGQYWLTGWNRRKNHRIIGTSAGAQIKYQVGIKVYKGAGADGDESVYGVTFGKIYCNGNCYDDFRSIRFTKWDGQTKLDYWMEEKTDGNFAIFWVELDEIPADPAAVHIYIYYDGPPHPTTSNGNATFAFFDDFEDEAIDDPPDAGKWTLYGTSNGRYILIKANPAGDGQVCDVHGYPGEYTRCTSKTWPGADLGEAAVGFRFRVENNAFFQHQVYKAAGGLFQAWALQPADHEWKRYRSQSPGGGWKDLAGDPPWAINTWHRIEERFLTSGITLNIDGTDYNGTIPYSYSYGTGPRQVRLFERPASSEGSQYHDNVYARKLRDPEPSHYTWGYEEQQEIDLPATFHVGQDSKDLPAKAIIRQVGTPVELYGHALITIPDSAEFYGHAIIRNISSQELYSKVLIQQPSEELYALAEIRQSDSVDLYASFEAQVSLNLPCVLIVRNISSQELYSKVLIQQPSEELYGHAEIRNVGSAELYGHAEIRQPASVELYGVAEIRQPGSEELYGFAEISQPASVEIYGHAEIQQSTSAEVYGHVIITIPDSVEIYCHAEIRQPTSVELYGTVEIQQPASAELYGVAEIRQPASEELYGIAEIQRVGAPVELYGHAEIRQPTSVELYAHVVIIHSEELYAHGIIKNIGSVELLGKFIIRRSSEFNPYCHFIVRQLTSTELYAHAIIIQPASTELYGHAIIRQPASTELYGHAIIRQPASTELYAHAIIRQPASTELYGHAIIRQPASAEVYALFIIRNIGSTELYGLVEIRQLASAEVYGHAEIRQEAFAELYASFEVQPAIPDFEDLYGHALIRQPVSAEVYAHFIIKKIDSAGVYAHFIIRNTSSVELYGHAEVRQPASVELYGVAEIRHPASADLYASFEAQVSLNLYAHAIIRNIDSAELYVHFIIRQLTSTELYGKLWTRHPYRLWTNRRYLNGVVELDEKNLSDPFLEYVIESVMGDIKSRLINENLTGYASWTDITKTPKLIRRAATYGTVASLYARDNNNPLQRIVLGIRPLAARAVLERQAQERAMDYWEGKFEKSLALFATSQSRKLMIVDTEDEEPVFSMEDIPFSTEDPYFTKSR